MHERGATFGVADEGGWWPDFSTNEQALEALVAAIERAGFVPGAQVAIALDVAASEFGRGGRYTLGLESRELDSDGMIELLLRWIDKYPIVSIEDPLAEDDPEAFARFTQAAGKTLQIVGDDFLVSNAALVREAAAAGAANTVLLKPNQRGTLTETRQAWRAAQRGRLCRHRVGALGRDRRHHHRAPRDRLGRRASSRSARSRAASAWPSGTRRCASRSGSAHARASPAWGHSGAIRWRAERGNGPAAGPTSLTECRGTSILPGFRWRCSTCVL